MHRSKVVKMGPTLLRKPDSSNLPTYGRVVLPHEDTGLRTGILRSGFARRSSVTHTNKHLC